MQNLPTELLAKIAMRCNKSGANVRQMYNLRKTCANFNYALAYTTRLTAKDKEIIDLIEEYYEISVNHSKMIWKLRNEGVDYPDRERVEKIENEMFEKIVKTISGYKICLVDRLDQILTKLAIDGKYDYHKLNVFNMVKISLCA